MRRELLLIGFNEGAVPQKCIIEGHNDYNERARGLRIWGSTKTNCTKLPRSLFFFAYITWSVMEYTIERMSIMAKVYEFPKRLELPEEEKEMLYLLSEAYVDVIYNSMAKLKDGRLTHEKMVEINHLIKQTFVEGMKLAIDKKEKGKS